MKIIHTADVHLDSKLNRHLEERQAKERRSELLLTFQRMVEYGAREGVEAIVIAGDLFDVSRISVTARNAVLAAIQGNPGITFYYLRGNHDADSFIQDVLEREGKLPGNLKLFSDTWISYEQMGADGSMVVITGAEVTAANNAKLLASLVLDQGKINLVTLHGQEVETAGKKDAEIIPIREYKNRGIDYLALGHIHAPKIERLDARGLYSYAGCLEGRGFDECGERGFNLLSIENGRLSVVFVPFAKRLMQELAVDVSEVLTSKEVALAIQKEAERKSVSSEDMVKVVLVGEVSMEAEFDLTYLVKSLEDRFYFLKVVDRTVPKVDYDRFALDASLKGEYVRNIQAAVDAGKLTREEAAEMIRLGVRLLMGEETLL